MPVLAADEGSPRPRRGRVRWPRPAAAKNISITISQSARVSRRQSRGGRQGRQLRRRGGAVRRRRRCASATRWCGVRASRAWARTPSSTRRSPCPWERSARAAGRTGSPSTTPTRTSTRSRRCRRSPWWWEIRHRRRSRYPRSRARTSPDRGTLAVTVKNLTPDTADRRRRRPRARGARGDGAARGR